jgi:hypothetical protein
MQNFHSNFIEGIQKINKPDGEKFNGIKEK